MAAAAASVDKNIYVKIQKELLLALLDLEYLTPRYALFESLWYWPFSWGGSVYTECKPDAIKRTKKWAKERGVTDPKILADLKLLLTQSDIDSASVIGLAKAELASEGFGKRIDPFLKCVLTLLANAEHQSFLEPTVVSAVTSLSRHRLTAFLESRSYLTNDNYYAPDGSLFTLAIDRSKEFSLLTEVFKEFSLEKYPSFVHAVLAVYPLVKDASSDSCDVFLAELLQWIDHSLLDIPFKDGRHILEVAAMKRNIGVFAAALARRPSCYPVPAAGAGRSISAESSASTSSYSIDTWWTRSESYSIRTWTRSEIIYSNGAKSSWRDWVISSFELALAVRDIDALKTLAYFFDDLVYLQKRCHDFVTGADCTSLGLCMEIVKKLVVEERRLNLRGWLSPLHKAVSLKLEESVILLLSYAPAIVDVNQREGEESAFNFTPLHYAVKLGNFEIVDLLLKKGANPSIKDSRLRTVTDLAREKSKDAGYSEKILPALLAVERSYAADSSSKISEVAGGGAGTCAGAGVESAAPSAPPGKAAGGAGVFYDEAVSKPARSGAGVEPVAPLASLSEAAGGDPTAVGVGLR